MHVIVASAMRTGSTWFVEVMRDILDCADGYAGTVAEANRMIRSTERIVIKTHELHDVHWPEIDPGAHIVRILRNYKDSLISRALYVRHIRTAENYPLSDDEFRDLVPDKAEASDEEVLAAFIDASPLVEAWLREIVLRERGWSDRVLTVLYETLQHNPYDAFAEIVTALWPDWEEGPQRVVPSVRHHLRRGVELRKEIYRSRVVGVGGWERWLTPEQGFRLDELYYRLRKEMESS